MHSPKKNQRPTIGLVLSGGGAKGLAHIGVLKVLEEAGIQPDYIGGTSMGSIIGGLYAMGYSVEFIEQMVKTQDWDQLIYDRFSRDHLNISEKGTDESFFVNFPLRSKKFMMPAGVIEAQEVTWLFSKLCTPVFRIRDFNQLQTPFLCIGTNIRTGESEVLNSGNLAFAMRTSMAIPGFFTSVDYQGNRMVDGGVVNNYPVMDVRAMGADIIIGSDVQSSNVSDEELESMTGAIMQIIGYHSKEAQYQAEAATDIYIHPDISDYGILSFNSADSLIQHGEAMARKFFPQLKALADSLNDIAPQVKKDRNIIPLEYIYVEDVEYLGLDRIEKKLLEGYKTFKTPGLVRVSDVEQWVRSLHGTKFFSLIRYEFLPVGENSAILRLSIQEASSRILSAGIHFDSDYKTAINLKASFRNWIFPESKANLILALGDNIKFRGDYWINWGLAPGPGLALDFNIVNFYNYEEQYKKEEIRVTDLQFTPFVKSIYKSFIELELGAQLEYSGLHAVTTYFPIKDINSVSINGVFAARLDTRNTLHFPVKGSYFDLNVKAIQSLSKASSHLYWFGSFDFNTSFRFSKLFSLRPNVTGVVASTGWEMAPHPQYKALMGGCSKYSMISGAIPFIGLNNLQRSGNIGYRVGLDAQFNVYKNKHFVVASFNAGDIEDDFKEIVNVTDMILGCGLTYSYNSFIGPISITVMGGNNLDFGAFFNLGFRL
ncbi:MAG: patatin-like phospholipase family protein [Bacteroidales bacterium]|nr:patatin-like phospholipase family protein [Bacteroidales bacterium]